MRAEAGTAAGVENGGAGVADDLRPAALFHLAEDLAGGGNDEHVDVGADLLAFKCLGDLLHVVQTAVGAAADDDLRDLDAGLLAHRNNVRGAEGAGDLRFKRGKIDLIGLEAVGFLLFGAEDGNHAADLDTHVADGHALGDGEIIDAGAGEKKAAVHEIVGAELAAEIQDESLAENVGGAVAGEIYLHNLGHLKVERAGRHGRGQLRGADADADLTVTAAGAGVGVSNTNDIAGILLMLFIHQLVDNAFTALIQGNAEFLGEVVHRPNIGAGLLRGGGAYMVNDQRHTAGIEDLLYADLAEHADGDGSRHVVRGDKAHLAGEILAGGDMFLASRFCQILFNKVHLQCPPGLFSRR